MQDCKVAAINTNADVAKWQAARHAFRQVVVQAHLAKFDKTRIVLVRSVDDITLVVEEVRLCTNRSGILVSCGNPVAIRVLLSDHSFNNNSILTNAVFCCLCQAFLSICPIGWNSCGQNLLSGSPPVR